MSKARRHTITLTPAERQTVRDALTLAILLRAGTPFGRRVMRVHGKFGRKEQR